MQIIPVTINSSNKKKSVQGRLHARYRQRLRVSFEPVLMKPSLDKPCLPRRTKLIALWLAVGFPLYVFSTGPIAWATNDAFHPAYLPDAVQVIYLPLMPLTRVEMVGDLFQWWTAVVWQGFPAGYTTL